jgi:excisionase family DNA binding protein
MKTMPENQETLDEILLIPIEKAAKLLSLSRTMVYELIRIEGLPVHRFNSAVRISPTELKAWLAGRQKESA